MIKIRFILLFSLSILLLSCNKEEDSITYIQAIINGKKSILTDVEAKITRVPIVNSTDSMEQLSVYGLRSDYSKYLILNVLTLKLLPEEYAFGSVSDSVLLVKATYCQDSNFFCTAYDNYLINPGSLIITKIGDNYVKGLFEFNAALRDNPDSVISISNGSFFAKIR